MVKSVNDNNFNAEVVESNIPVVVDFWAPWCGPCRMLGPVVEEVSNQYDGKVKFVKVNVDENPDVSRMFRIASIPTVMVFKGGSVKETMVGFKPKAALEGIVNKYV